MGNIRMFAEVGETLKEATMLTQQAYDGWYKSAPSHRTRQVAAAAEVVRLGPYDELMRPVMGYGVLLVGVVEWL